MTRPRLAASVFALILGSIASIPTARAITIRHDQDDARYVEMAARFPAVCRVGRADGTLIAPKWILTAAHVARDVLGRPPEARRVTCGGGDYAVIGGVLHPDWTDMGPHDIALLELAVPVVDVAPIPIYKGSDEKGRTVAIVGDGATRTGLGGKWIEDGRFRAATTRVTRADDRWLYLEFREPPDASPLEGAPGRGDSGGPAIIETKAGPFVAGISSLGYDGKNGPATYGAIDHFVRVSRYVEWIQDAMREQPINGKAP